MELPLDVSNGTSRFLAKTCLFSSRHKSNSAFFNIFVDTKQKLFSNPQFSRSAGSKLVCIHCFTPWKEGKFRLRLIAKTPKKSLKKIMKRPPSARNSFETKLMSKWNENGKNVLAKKCLVCNVYTHETMEKSLSHPQKETEIEQTSVELEDEPKKKKKKKKKKVKFAGLNPIAVDSIRKAVQQSVKPKKSKRIEKLVSKKDITSDVMKESVKCEKKPIPKSVPLASFDVTLNVPAEPVTFPGTIFNLIKEVDESDHSHPEMSMIFSSLNVINPDKLKNESPKGTSTSADTVDVKSLPPRVESESNRKLSVKANDNPNIMLPTTSFARESKKEKEIKKNNSSFIFKSLKPIKKNKEKKKMKSHSKNLQRLPKTSLLLKELLE